MLIDEIDKSDLDFANDILNVIEEGYFDIPELRRLKKKTVKVRDSLKRIVEVTEGHISSGQFPFVLMTSNADREFPPPFLRRCVRLHIDQPKAEELGDIVKSHLNEYGDSLKEKDIQELINTFENLRQENKEVATDQLLNAVFLTVAMRDSQERSFLPKEVKVLRKNLFRELSGSDA